MYPCHGLRMGFPQTMSPCWAPWWVGSIGGETLRTNMTDPGTMMIVNKLSETENKPLEILTSDLPRKITICSVFPGQKPSYH